MQYWRIAHYNFGFPKLPPMLCAWGVCGPKEEERLREWLSGRAPGAEHAQDLDCFISIKLVSSCRTPATEFSFLFMLKVRKPRKWVCKLYQKLELVRCQPFCKIFFSGLVSRWVFYMTVTGRGLLTQHLPPRNFHQLPYSFLWRESESIFWLSSFCYQGGNLLYFHKNRFSSVLI